MSVLDRDEVGWLLWCFAEGYVHPEDREGMVNWFRSDASVLHSEDVVEREAYRASADLLLAQLRVMIGDFGVVYLCLLDPDCSGLEHSSDCREQNERRKVALVGRERAARRERMCRDIEGPPVVPVVPFVTPR